MNNRRVTMADVAAQVGVSRVAVSMALRNHHRISAQRREEIQRVAREMGFLPDPLLSALAVHQRQQSPVAEHGVLAWINRWADPRRLRSFKEFDLYWRGASHTAGKYGFRLDEILWEENCSPKRLEGILLARGIQGVLIPPHHDPIDWGDFDWSKFSVVRFGLSVRDPDANVVAADIHRATVLAIGKMHEAGYRRIGLTVNERSNQKLGGTLLSGFFYSQESHGLKPALPPLLTFLETRSVEELARQKCALAEWLNEHRPDALLTSDIEVPGMLRELGYRIPTDIAVTGTTVWDIPGVDAGVDQHAEEIGRTGVETLLKQMNLGERGVPLHPVRILVESRWKNGKSLPRMSETPSMESTPACAAEASGCNTIVRRVTLKDIAALAGVSKITVSLALRQSPRVSSQTRDNILRIADELGFTNDPILQRLGAYRRTEATGGFRNVIAWLNHWQEPQSLRRHVEFQQYWRGAKRAAVRLGYQLEEVVWPADWSAERVQELLHDSGALGLLIPPHKQEVEWGGFDWSRFSLVRFGYSVREVDANLVTADHLRAMVMAVRKIHGHGYRRIGLVYDATHDRYMGGNVFGGFKCGLNLLGIDSRIPPLDLKFMDSDLQRKRDLQRWMREHRPDAIITSRPPTLKLLGELRYRIPHDVAVAGTSIHDIPLDAGIDQCPQTIGQIAAQTLVKQISLKERGEPADPCRILVESRWREGLSLPPR